MSVNIFVYGTLKTGEPNHYWFEEASANDGARVDLVGAGITLEKLPLIVATEFNIPMLLGWLNNILHNTYMRSKLFRSSRSWPTDKGRSLHNR